MLVAQVRVRIDSAPRAEFELFHWYDAAGNLKNPGETPYTAGLIPVVEYDYPLDSSGSLVVTTTNQFGQSVKEFAFVTSHPEGPPPPPPPPGEAPGEPTLTLVEIVYIER